MKALDQTTQSEVLWPEAKEHGGNRKSCDASGKHSTVQQSHRQ
jgi:hypothetical protein